MTDELRQAIADNGNDQRGDGGQLWNAGYAHVNLAERRQIGFTLNSQILRI